MSRRSDQRIKHSQQQAENDLRWLMSDAKGRRFIHSLIVEAGIDTVSPFTGNSATFYKIGQQDLVRGLLGNCRRVALQEVRLMEDEALQANQRAELERDQPGDDDPEA